MFKNLKGTKVKLILIGGLIAVIIASILAVVMVNVRKARLAKAAPELARAMTYDEVEDGDEIVENTEGNVKFDAFFLRDLDGDGYAESIRGTSKEIGKEDTLYMEINVDTAGYLKDAKITINEGNFYFQTALPKDDELKDSYVGNNTRVIEFNDLNNGTQKLITGIVRSGDYSYSSTKAAAIGNNINNYSKVNSVTFTGTYVNGEETIEISKTVNFNIDWYGTAKASIYTTSQNYYDIADRIDEENGQITLDFTVRTQETNYALILKDNHVEAQIPQLNGYDPISVTYTGSVGTSSYNSATRTLTIDKESVVGEDGNITTGLSRDNSYGIRVVYPIEAYQSLGEDTVTIKIPVSTYYEGYNNPNEEFTNPYKSNTATTTITASYQGPKTEAADIEVEVGKYIYTPSRRYVVSKQKPLRIYNGVSDSETDDTYQVRWYVSTGTNGESTGLVLKETQNDQAQVADNFIKTDSSKDSMENITTNVGIGFSGVDNVLKEDGWIKVYDEDTGDLLVTFTKSDWNKYTSSNPYKYELPVKHIRVETSETNASSSFYVYNIKELDDEYITTNYTKEEFDNLQYIESNLVGYLGGTYIGSDTHRANYEAPYSIADIGISNNTISTQSTEKNEKITITARNDSSANQVGWVNGSFVVKLPEEILTAEINNVEINNSSVSITSYELVEEDGVKLIKINTQNNNSTPQTYSITIDVDLTPDPRKATTTKNLELYASNEETSEYYYNANDIYDVNDNLNTEEKVNYDTTSLSMVSPNSLLTNQVGSNFDDKGTEVISPEIADVKPVYGVIDQEGEKTVQIGVQLKNNYGSTISDIQIVGKIPFEGNTYVLSGGDLGSTFTTNMTEAGITVPEGLQQYATVYYSENENPTNDLNDEANGWKTAEEVTNWDNIKTFLIDLGDYVMPTGAEYIFNYIVKIPNGLEFNQASFSHHGVYFSLDTEQGKYRTQTEPNKLGFRIAEKYNLELTKYQTGKDKLVPGATYSITDEATGETKTAVTNAQGMLTINNLYVEKTYLIKEIKTPSDYELNSDVIRFIGHVDEDGNLSIDKTQGTTKEDMSVVKNEGEDYKVTVKVEDEVKASIKIHKTEQGTETPLQNVKYKLTGYGISESGKTITTNSNGEVTINGLSVNQEYTLTETKAEGYYLASPIKFKIVNNDGNYSIEQITEEGVESGTIKGQSTEEVDGIPTITLNLEDEKIPTYSLQIIKQEKTIETELTEDKEKASTTENTEETTYLEGAKFKLYKEDKEIGEYITDGTGRVTIDNLYQYIDGKDEEATYTLKEVLAPVGYAKVKDITFKVNGTDGTLQFINTNGEEENYTVDGNTVKLTIDDSPSFRLIKKDEESGMTLSGVKFAIYNVEDGEIPATNSKGEILGTKETINGKEYYTLTTDEQGVITADLTEGLYKAVEVEAPDKYDISNQTYYFGIGASREAEEDMLPVWAESFGGSSNDYIKSVAETSDGGYIAGGYFQSSTIQVGDYTLKNNSTTSNSDGLIIKYDAEGEVEWAKSFGGSSNEQINSVASTSDGGYIAGGYFCSSSIDFGNSITLKNNSTTSYSDGLIIKYDAEGEVEWTDSFGGSSYDGINSVAETSDGGYIVGGYFYSSTIEVDGHTLTSNGSYDGLIIKYDAEGEVEWAKSIGGSSIERIQSVASTSDGGVVAGGYFRSSIQVGSEKLTSNGYEDGIIIKYNGEGEVEWAKSIGESSSDYITSVAETSDGGVVAGGYFNSSTIQVGSEKLTSKGSSDGIIIKYDAEGEVEWAKSFGGSSYDEINSVVATSDGGAIVGGYFRSSSQVGGEKLTSNGYEDGLIIKYDAEGEVEWAKSIGGSSSDYINSVASTSDGGVIAGGYFRSSTIQVGNDTLTNNGSTSCTDGMVIKYENQELPNPVVTNAKVIGGSSSDQINSVASTSDGGVIAGGYFQSNTIQVGSEKLTSNGSRDGIIIKYDAEGEVEWAKSIGGSSSDIIYSVASTSDGGAIAGGYFQSSTIQVGSETLTNSTSYSDGIIIKYDAEGEVEWAKSIGGSSHDYIYSVASTSDGGYIAGGFFISTIQIENVTLTSNGSEDGLIIKYDAEGEVEWAKSFGGSSYDEINSVVATSDGGAIVGGYFRSSSIDFGNGIVLTNNSSSTSYNDGIIIKYDAEGEVEWAKSIGGSSSDIIYSVASTSDGGAIAGGYFQSSTIQVGSETLTNSTSYSDGIIIKYDAEGEVEWAKSIGGSSHDYIYSVASTSDGGYIAGGYFYSSIIKVGSETIANNNSGYYDGLIIKYDAEGKIEWARSFGGSSSDYINSLTETIGGKVVAGGYFISSVIEVDGHTLTNNRSGYSDGMILEVVNEVGVPEVQELTVVNGRKEFKITTDVNEIDGVKGGSISGEDKNPYETVKYGDSSKNEIIMTPDENYEIIGITVNEKEWPFEANEDGTYKMPAFENMTEDKHVVVTYALKDNKIIINKVDSEDNNIKLAGATFKLDQLEERNEPINESIIGEMQANGQEYAVADTEKGPVEGVLGELTNNGTYYFVQNEDGTYTPTNSKTYQIANGGNAGIQNSTANSYIPIDLSGKEGEYVVVVNASISSESFDYGYATVNTNTAAPSYSTSAGRFMYISGTVDSKDYTSTTVLEGNQTYYLHLGYRKDGSADTGDDQVVINSINVYEASSISYNFVDNNSGGYESNNQGQDNTVANSYMEIDLRDYTGKYNLTVNANISSQSNDYGYATVTNTTTAPSYSSSEGRFIYISGTTTPTDYTTILQGGQMYYLHFGYYKDSSTSSGDDKFTINSVKISLNGDDLYHTEVTTNSEGQAITQIPFGKYQITEIVAPEGYELNSNPIEVDFRADGNHEFMIENNKKAQVIVHHYLKNENGEYTTTKVAEDELLEGKIGDKYTTSPKLDLDKYELEKDEEGNYVIPSNATGVYESGVIEVTYYYEEKEIPLTVHHYIEGTTTAVPLKDGGEAEDVTDSGKEGESYETNAIEDSLLSEDYELVEVPENANGTYSGEEVTVTYYYKRVSRQVVLNKYDEDGETPLQGVKFEIQSKDNNENTIEATTDTNGQIKVNLESGDYTATEVEVPEGYDLPDDNETEFSVTKADDVVTLNVTNTKTKGTVITHYYIENTTDKVPLQDGGTAEDVTQTGNVGDIYATKEAENVSDKYELVSTVGNTSGTIQEGTTEVIYYYKLKDTSVLVHHYIEGTETKVPSKNGGVVEDETITGKVDDSYNTSASSNVANNYELVTTPANATGTMTLDQIVVTYYYKLKDPTIENSKIEKNSTVEKVTEKDQAVPYTITYTANVKDYIGDAVVTIIDTLPYEIVEESSSLDGGQYDSSSMTITWTENISGIDTYNNVNNQINITKNISLVYKDLDVTKENVTNKVTGTINLKTPEKTDTKEDTEDIPTEFLVNVPVTKIWDDNGNSAKKRPSEVTFVLTSSDVNDENSPYKHTLDTNNVDSQINNKWTYTFTGLPRYDSTGNEIVYTLSEVLDNIYYTAENANIDQDSKTITNTFKVPTDTIDVPVTKVWNDNSNIAKKRPASVDFVLNGSDGSGPYRYTLTEKNVDSENGDKWIYTFTNLPKYNSVNGDEITYTLSEENVNSDFYVASVEQGTKTVTNTFTVPEDKITVTAKKYWDDNSNANGRRPESATLTLTGKGQGVDISREQTVTESNKVDGDTNTWEYTFTELPKYDEYGDEVEYTINERDLNNEFYIKSEVNQETRTVTNKFQVPGDKINVTVTKVWDDNSDSAGKRPESVTLQVKNGDVVVASEPVTESNKVDGDANRWSYTFSVPKYNEQAQEITYTADEQDTGSIFYTVENKKIEGNMTSGYTITNKFVVPDEKISVPVTKVWDDNSNSANKRPTSVTMVLTSNDTTDIYSPYKYTLTADSNVDSQDSNKWTYTFENLPKYDSKGDEIVYTLSEELNNIYYTSVNSKVDQGTKTITNTFKVPTDTIDVPVVKEWDDNGNVAGKRLGSVTLVLTGNDTNDTHNPYKHTLTAENVDNSNTNRWLYTFTGLPKYNSVNGDEIVYTLSEEKSSETNSKFYTTENSVVSQETKTVTNKFEVPNEKTSVTVTKIWDDEDNKVNKRPGSVTMTLTGTGEGVNSSYEQTLTSEANVDPSNENQWVYTFNDLPKLDNYGNEITYTVDEEDLGNKYYSKGNVDQDAKTVTNVSEYGKVIVHHYIMNTDGTTTTTKVPSSDGGEVQDQVIEGAQGEDYTTNAAENIKPNYELVQDKLPENATGTITEEDTEVIYYYRLKTPSVTNTVTKTGTDRITSANQEVSYTITYTANVTDYIGNAEVTIVDTLPYALDTSKSNDLDGGTYDAVSHTITWKENVSDLNSYTGNGTVQITKNITVVYTGLDMNQEKITNNVTGQIKLLTPEKTSDETTNSFETPIYKAIISSEKLVDKTEAVEGDKVTYTVKIKNEGNLAKTVTLKDTLPEGLTFDNNTQIMVGNVGTVYTEQNLKNGISVDVPAEASVDVTFAGIVDTLPKDTYREELINRATVDNEPTNDVTTTVTKPNISAHKESDPASGTKVSEGDTITYRIRVRNDGTREGTVVVKDTIPTGTAFVDKSVKIGELEDLTKTAEDLQNGISVTLGINEEKVVEFKVTVNKQVDGTVIKNVAYINDGTGDKKVPEEPEHTYVEPKEEQEISKTGTSTIDNLDDEITYNISYTAEISDYEGNAKVVLVDQLPYAIDTEKSELDGGTYDEEKHTITWEQEVTDIQMENTKEVEINKTIKVVYTGISQETVSIENVVKGHIEYETPDTTSDEVEANWTTTTGFVINIPVSKVWEDSDNKLGQRPTRVVFKLTGSDGSDRTLELAKPGTEGSTTTQDSNNLNKWNDMFKDLPKYDASNNEIVYTLTEEEKTEGDLKYYDSNVDGESYTVTNTNKYGKVTVHHYIINPDGTKTENKVPDKDGTEIPDEVIEGKEGDSYTTEPADNISDKYELVQEELPENPDGTIEKYDEEKPQEVIYYYRLKPAKVIIHYLEKDEDTNDSNNQVLSTDEQIEGHVDDSYNTNTDHRKETIEKDGKKYTLVEDSGNTEGTMTIEDTNVTYYYLQNTKATVRYVARDPVTHEEIKDLETPYTEEGLVGDEFVTNSKEFTGYKLVESPEKTTIKMTKEEQTLIYYYEPVTTGLLENHIDDKTGKLLYTEEHDVQVGDSYNIPSKNFEGYDLVTSKLPDNASGTMGEELVTVNYYYIKKAVLEVHYVDKATGEPLADPIIDNTKHEGDEYTTEEKTFEDYDLVEVPANKDGTLKVETDENGNITNNKTVVTYYYAKKAEVEEHHIDIATGKELEDPTLHEGHVGDAYDIKSKDFLSYEVATTDKDGNNVLPTNATGTMTEEKIVVTYYYYQPAKVIVHYVDKTTGKEIEEQNPETGELQNSQVVIEGQKDYEYTTEAKKFEYYTLVEIPEEPDGTMKVEITKDENGNDVVNNTIDVYYYYEPKPFNIGVEKEITGIIVNGERRSATNGKIEKVDIYRKSTENTSVQVEYKIKVMNTGEVKGRAIIEDKLPEGMSLANNDGTWEEEDGSLTKVIPEIGAGETKEYTVLLNWKTSGNNMGNKVNEVSLIQTDNVPGFADSDDKDNTDQATVSISVETGELPVGLLIALAGLVALESVTLRYAVVLTKRQKKANKK